MTAELAGQRRQLLASTNNAELEGNDWVITHLVSTHAHRTKNAKIGSVLETSEIQIHPPYSFIYSYLSSPLFVCRFPKTPYRTVFSPLHFPPPQTMKICIAVAVSAILATTSSPVAAASSTPTREAATRALQAVRFAEVAAASRYHDSDKSGRFLQSQTCKDDTEALSNSTTMMEIEAQAQAAIAADLLNPEEFCDIDEDTSSATCSIDFADIGDMTSTVKSICDEGMLFMRRVLRAVSLFFLTHISHARSHPLTCSLVQSSHLLTIFSRREVRPVHGEPGIEVLHGGDQSRPQLPEHP